MWKSRDGKFSFDFFVVVDVVVAVVYTLYIYKKPTHKFRIIFWFFHYGKKI